MALELDDFLEGAAAVGFREGRDWLFSPEPLRLGEGERRHIERLGHPLRMFQEACEAIYPKQQQQKVHKLQKWLVSNAREGGEGGGRRKGNDL